MQLDRKITTRELAFGAVVAALYTALTLLLMPWSFSNVQVRFAEALTILPIFSPAAIPGLFVGCLISNIVGGVSTLDMIVGPLATLIAAVLTYWLRKRPVLAAAPPVIVNALVVGATLYAAGYGPLWIMIGSVGLGQLIACYGVGLPLYYALKRVPVMELRP